LDNKSDVVIIGGGCIGASIALHLARGNKAGRIILIEKGSIASGSTSMSSAIIRIRYWNEVTAKIGLKAWRVFSDFENKIGSGSSGFKKCGVLWLIGEDQVKDMEQNVRLLQKIGAEAKMLYGKDILHIDPQLSLDGISAAAWEPNSGYAEPTLTTDSFIRAARQLGVEIQQFTRVQSIEVSSGHVMGVQTSNGFIESPKVVCATGIWSQEIFKTVGIEIPIKPTRVQLGLFRTPQGLRENPPIVSDFTSGEYYRPFGSDITKVGSSLVDNSVVDPNNIDISPSWEAIESMANAFSKRFPNLNGARYFSGYAYAYDNTPDHHPILDELKTSRIEGGLYCAVGFSGHGFKESPIVGEMMAELITDGKKLSDEINFFRFSRFEENKLIHSPFPGG
jgi:sarcosine oxidase subunit beta